MAHYSEMEFLFTKNISDKTEVTKILDNNSNDNIYNMFSANEYVVYKNRFKKTGGENIIKYYEENLEKSNQNPYTKLLNDFSDVSGNARAGLQLKAADLAYLRDLGVYPINRMAILRRFPEGCFVPEDLNEMKIEPISTVVGWIKPDQNFGTVGFNEKWTTTTERFDVVLSNIVKKALKIEKAGPLIPIPDFAQGVLFEFYKELDLLDRSGTDDSVDEVYEGSSRDSSSPWGLSKVPIGDPNVLQEGPFRDPDGQNIQSNFQFELETTYEQKILGEVDPGSAMLDILDNLYTMGTSNMTFYWGDSSPTIRNAMKAASGDGNNLNSWWEFTSQIMTKMWELVTKLFKNLWEKTKELAEATIPKTSEENEAIIDKANAEIKRLEGLKNTQTSVSEATDINLKITKQKSIIAEAKNSNIVSNTIAKVNKTKEKIKASDNFINDTLQTILTSTIAISRFKIRGSIELMVGGKYSSTPWYLTLGNPYTPWLATNHMIVKSASIETSNEMGFNDQPQRLTAKFNCEFSRALGKQELMRMFNNSFRRTYSSPTNLKFVDKQQLQKIQPENTSVIWGKDITGHDQASNVIDDVTSTAKGNSRIESIKTPIIGNSSVGNQGLSGLKK